MNKNFPGTDLPHNKIKVGCANFSTMNSVATKEIHIGLLLPPKAAKIHAFDEMNNNLISIPQLCAAGCECQFNKSNVNIICNSQTINGTRDPVMNL